MSGLCGGATGLERGGAGSPWWGRTAAAVVATVLLVAFGAALQVARDRATADGPAPPDARSVPPAELVQRAALSFEAVLADLYWIRAVQHYGRTRLSGGAAGDYALLHPLLDVATTLDPRFDAAYRLGAVFLAEPPPGGAGRPDLAVALLRKGFASVPGRWQYLQDIGFIHYWWLRDRDEAARWFQRAADIPGAPWWLRFLAATTMTEGGDRAGARALWRFVRDAAEDSWMRREAARRLTQIEALDALDGYQRTVDRFRERTGRAPGSWQDLVAAGDLSTVPVDPTGSVYELTPFGAVTVSPRSVLNPLPAGDSLPVRPAG